MWYKKIKLQLQLDIANPSLTIFCLQYMRTTGCLILFLCSDKFRSKKSCGNCLCVYIDGCRVKNTHFYFNEVCLRMNCHELILSTNSISCLDMLLVSLDLARKLAGANSLKKFHTQLKIYLYINTAYILFWWEIEDKSSTPGCWFCSTLVLFLDWKFQQINILSY